MTDSSRVVILLGTNFSGSHLLSHLLSAHSQCLGVGEIHRFQKLLESGGEAPVVSEYNSDPLFDGLAAEPVENWHEILLQRIAARLELAEPVIIDNSKKVEWAVRIAKNSNLDIRFVHLVRDPRALVLRWLKTYETPRQQRRQRLRVARRMPARAPRILAGDLVTVYIYKWLRANRQILSYLKRVGNSSTLVTYHDMVFDTRQMLERLMPELGLDFEPGQLRFGEGTNFGTMKTAHAESVRRSEIRPDMKWQHDLPVDAIRAIETDADIGGYLAEQGLRFSPDGLVADSV